MRRTSKITTVALAAALSLPAVADAHQARSAIASSDVTSLLADATPLTSAPVPAHAPSLEHAPLAARNRELLASRDRQLLADAGNPERLLAQAAPATTTPPATSLPRTGPEIYLTLLAGGGLLLTGAGLRLRGRGTVSAASEASGAPRPVAAAGSQTSGGIALGSVATADGAR